MAFLYRTKLPGLFDYIDDPPEVFKEGVGVKGWKDKHDNVYQYAKAHFLNVASDTDADNWRQRCTEYTQWYLGTENRIKRYDELEIIQVNLLQMFMQLKHSKLLSDRLKVHYVSRYNHDWEFAQAMNRLFDWHGQRVGRNKLQEMIELTTPLYGMTGVFYRPEIHWIGGKEELIPAEWEYLDPRCMFFEPRWMKDRDMPVF